MAEFWPGGSKLHAVTQLLTLTLERKRSQFCPLILEVVKQSMTWRGKREPLTRAEVDQLNTLLPGVGFKIPDLLDPDFLGTLAGSPALKHQPALGHLRPQHPSRPHWRLWPVVWWISRASLRKRAALPSRVS